MPKSEPSGTWLENSETEVDLSGAAPTGPKITVLALGRSVADSVVDPIAEASELSDHFSSAPLLRLFVDG